MSDATWLPNLVSGTSIWKLAVDLNEPKFFDGRLLVPETEGSESLPVTVRWDLTGLMPLAEARTKHPDDVANAVKDLQACLERVAKVFTTPNSGFDKYKDAFTVPSLDADNGANYFYSPAKKKLFVINWGASPRSMGGKAEYVFGFEDWAKQWAPAGAAVLGAAAIAGAAKSTPPPAPNAEATKEERKKDDKKEEQKKDDKKRPWWMWPLFGLVVILLVLLALFLLRACDEPNTKGAADAALDAPAEGASSADAATDAALAEAGADGAAGSDGDGGAAGDGGDAGGDAGALADGGDAGAKDGGKDGGPAGDDDDEDDGNPTVGSSGGIGPGGGPVVVKVFPGNGGTGAKTSVHRKHYSDDAVKWRIGAGGNKVARTEDAGKRFDVWLAPGQTFEGVRVEWQDKAGKWHVH